MRKYNDM